MKIKDLLLENIKSEVISAYSDQMDSRITYQVGDDIKGTLDYTVFNDEVSIKMIEVYDTRKGIGKTMVKYLQGEYPETEIEWGLTTEEGEALRQSLTYKTIETEYKPLFDEYQQLEKENAYLQSQVDEFYDIDQPTDEQKAAFHKLIPRFDIVNDRLDDLKDILRNQSPYKKIII